jgi:outer membrane protein assembly factor BamB
MKNKITVVAMIAVALSLIPTAPVNAQDWAQWRGPKRDGLIASFSPPATWPNKLTQVWKVPVGIGHSSPVVTGGRVYVFSREGEEEAVSCFSLDTGRLIWKSKYATAYTMNPAAVGHGKGPKSTPVLDGGNIYSLGITGTLSCYEAETGRVKWSRTFSKQYKAASPLYGTAMSPVVYRGMIIAHVGGNDSGALCAFDKENGDVKWTWDGDGPGYASPIVVSVGGTDQIVTQTQKLIVGVAAATGQLLWSMPFETEYVQNIVTPVAYKDTIIISGIDKGTTELRIRKQQGKWVPETVWRNSEVSMYMSSPVVIGDYLYGMSHKRKGQFFCIDARTGKTQWLSNGREGDNAAVVAGGRFLIALTDSAELTVMRTDSAKLDVVKKYTVAESPTWAHPVIVGNRVLIKDVNSLALLSTQ